MKDNIQKNFSDTKERYLSSEYANQYKEEYDNGLKFKRIRSRIIAKREIAVIHTILRNIHRFDGLVLDVPCGTGKIAKALSLFPVNVLAGDISAQMIELAKHEYNPEKFRGFIRLNVAESPFVKCGVSDIICLRLFQRYSEDVRKKVLNEFKRIVRSNLIISYSYTSTWQRARQLIRSIYDNSKPSFYHVEIKNIIKELEEAGFKPKQWQYVLPGLSSEVVFHAVT